MFMKDKEAREDIGTLKDEVEKLKKTMSSHRHELGNGKVYIEYV